MKLRQIVAIFGMAAVSLGAQNSPTASLTLEQAEALALKEHPSLLASEAVYQRADQLTREARAAYFPTLEGEITGAQANRGARLGAGVLNDPQLFSHFGSGLSLSQLISDSGRSQNLVAQARLNAQAGREDSRATRYKVIANVDEAYYQTLLAQQLVKVAEETVKTRQALVDQISELTKNKLKSDLDLKFVQVNLAEAQLMLLRANDGVAAAYAALGQALGEQHAVQYRLVETAAPADPPPTDPEALVEEAFRNRPEVASLHLEAEADRKFVYAERDLKRPTVSLMAAAGVLPYINPGTANSDIPHEYEAAGVNVEVPLFNGHLFAARRQAAEYQLSVSEQKLRELQNQIAADVRVACARTVTAYQAISTSEALLQQSRMALDLAQGRYDLGLSSIVELTQAQLGLTQAEVENLTARYQYQEAHAILQYTLGLVHR